MADIQPNAPKPNANVLPSPPPGLDDQVISSIDYTWRDEIVDAMIELVTCPILCEPSKNMIIFIMQCYDTASFQSH